MENIKNYEVFTPSILNAFLPLYLKSLFFVILTLLPFYVIFYIINLFFIKFEINIFLILLLVLILLIIPFILSIKKFINVYNTSYYLYPTRLEERFEFFKTKTFYIPYDQIVDMRTEASFGIDYVEFQILKLLEDL